MSGKPDNSAEPVGTLQQALDHAERLLASDAALATQQAREILAAVPGQPTALLILGIAHRLAGDAAASIAVLEPLARTQPDSVAPHYQLALSQGAAGHGDAAVMSLQRTLALQSDHADAWRLLSDHLAALGDSDGAEDALARYLRFSTRDPRLMEAALHLCEGRLNPAETLLRAHLHEKPTDVAAIRMFAELAARLGRYGDAGKLLARCLELAPGFTGARHNHAVVLLRQNRLEEALAEIDRALASDARNPGYRNLKAAILGRIGDFDAAIALYREVLAEYPGQPKAWMSFGHALKSAGLADECISAYRKCIELGPQLGEAWWSLANMKTFRFSEADCIAMRAQLEAGKPSDEDRFHFHFALAKAAEDTGEYQQAFDHYLAGNRQRRAFIDYDPDETSANVDRCISLFSNGLFASRQGAGCPAPDPIFIVGLPRSGSTLLEQILASHSQVEGTMELPDMIAISRALGERKTRGEPTKYPEVLASLAPEELRRLGEQYLEQTRVQRRTDAPFFIDKMPNNFLHAGLIHLILPKAKIIDARRHPLGCCFSGFKQHFARGQHFTYSLEDLGRYYSDYVRLMAHFDRVLPKRIHRVIYEQMIDDTEAVVRRLLQYCGLPYEEGCLQFYENERPVRTASSEQVRQPIYREGVDHWRNFEPWLDPLKAALGPALTNYASAGKG